MILQSTSTVSISQTGLRFESNKSLALSCRPYAALKVFRCMQVVGSGSLAKMPAEDQMSAATLGPLSIDRVWSSINERAYNRRQYPMLSFGRQNYLQTMTLEMARRVITDNKGFDLKSLNRRDRLQRQHVYQKRFQAYFLATTFNERLARIKELLSLSNPAAAVLWAARNAKLPLGEELRQQLGRNSEVTKTQIEKRKALEDELTADQEPTTVVMQAEPPISQARPNLAQSTIAASDISPRTALRMLLRDRPKLAASMNVRDKFTKRSTLLPFAAMLYCKRKGMFERTVRQRGISQEEARQDLEWAIQECAELDVVFERETYSKLMRSSVITDHSGAGGLAEAIHKLRENHFRAQRLENTHANGSNPAAHLQGEQVTSAKEEIPQAKTTPTKDTSASANKVSSALARVGSFFFGLKTPKPKAVGALSDEPEAKAGPESGSVAQGKSAIDLSETRQTESPEPLQEPITPQRASPKTAPVSSSRRKQPSKSLTVVRKYPTHRKLPSDIRGVVRRPLVRTST